MDATTFWVARGLRLPGLGLLVLPAAPAPAWLTALPLHTSLRLRLHRPGHAPLALLATAEELTQPEQPPARALLLDADPGGPLGPEASLELLEVAPDCLSPS